MAGKDYDPIDCSLHDRLEEYSTLGQPVRISFKGDEGEELATEGRINDIFSERGAEYLKLDNGDTVRLDRIDAVDGRPSASTRSRD